jgi:hypothetical protein
MDKVQEEETQTRKRSPLPPLFLPDSQFDFARFQANRTEVCDLNSPILIEEFVVHFIAPGSRPRARVKPKDERLPLKRFRPASAMPRESRLPLHRLELPPPVRFNRKVKRVQRHDQ